MSQYMIFYFFLIEVFPTVIALNLFIIFILFIVIIAIQLFYYGIIFSKFAFAKLPKTTPKKIPISVIVCAKNEAENVVKYLPLLAEQNYPDYEIVLIDDASSDTTLDLFEEFEKNPTKLLDFEMIETEAEAESAVETKGQNVFDFLIDEFAKIPNKKERLKSAYKALACNILYGVACLVSR
jgi:cellulose synthase/poly-beta-1,6-N-acetylglucosamine synthase-like glycosyltransferase